MKKRIRQAGIATLLLALMRSTSAAQVSDVHSADAHIEAERLLMAARSALDAEKYEDAYEALRQAWALDKTYRTAGNLALIEMHLGTMRDAAEHLQFSLLRFPWREGAEEKMARLEQHLQTAKSHIGTLKLKVDVRGAAMHIDGFLVATSPLFDLYVNPGWRLLEVSKAGYRSVRKVLWFAAGTEHHLQVTLEPVATSPSAQEAVEINPDSAQEVVFGLRPPQQKAMSSKSNQPNRTKPPEAQVPQEESKLPVRKIVIASGIATSAVLLGIGAGLAVMSNQTASEADVLRKKVEKGGSLNTCHTPGHASACDKLRALGEDQTWSANGAFWSLIAGGLLAAGTGTYTLVTRSNAQPRAAQVIPVVGARHAGVVVHGRW